MVSRAVSSWPADAELDDGEVDTDPVYAPSTIDPSDAPTTEQVYGDEMTLDEVAREFGLSREGVRLVERRALRRFARAAWLAGLIPTLPSAHVSRGHAERRAAPRPPADDDLDDDDVDDEDDDAYPRRRSFVSFFSKSSNKRLCNSIWNMVEKRRPRGDGAAR